MDHYRAYIFARQTAEHLLLAYASEPHSYAQQFHEKNALRDLTRLADDLGFDLVKREPKQEAA